MDPRLDLARELELRDAAVADRLERLESLAREADRIRARAGELMAFFERLPTEREHAESALADAEAALERAREAHASAAAEREPASADAAVRAAEERIERLRARLAALEREAEESQADAAALAEAAAAAARELEAEPRVTLAAPAGASLADVLDWAARAHAAILVARSGLDVERERIFREANELGASVLGEPLQAANVSLVRRRVEERLGD